MDKRGLAHRKYHLHDGKKGAAFAVRVVPGSDKDEITAILENGIIQITLLSSDKQGENNQRLVNLLAKVFKVPKTQVEVVAGMSKQEKLVAILDMNTELANNKIESYLQDL